MLKTLRVQITATAAGVACMVVAVIAAGFSVFAALRLAVGEVLASALTALIFLVIAVGLLMALRQEEQQAEQSALAAEAHGPKRWAVMAGELVGAFALGALGGRSRRVRR